MKKKVTNLTMVFLIGFLILAASQPFITTNYQRTIYFWNDIPVLITYLLTILFFLFMNSNTKIKRIHALTTIIFYFISLHYFYNENCPDNNLIALIWTKELIIIFILFATCFLSRTLNKKSTEFNMYRMSFLTISTITIFLFTSLIIDNFVKLHIGIYLYFFAFLSFIAMYLVSQKEKKTIPNIAKIIREPIDLSDSFIYANYYEGISVDETIKDNLSTIINREKKRELMVFVYSDRNSPYRLEYSRIKKIKLHIESYDAKQHKKKEKSELVKPIMMGTVLNTLNAQAASEEFQTQLDLYTESTPETVTHISIIYELQKKEKELHFYTKKDPSLFFETLEKTLPFPIERI